LHSLHFVSKFSKIAILTDENIPVSFIISGVTSIEAEDIAISFINSKDKKISNFLMEQNDSLTT